MKARGLAEVHHVEQLHVLREQLCLRVLRGPPDGQEEPQRGAQEEAAARGGQGRAAPLGTRGAAVALMTRIAKYVWRLASVCEFGVSTHTEHRHVNSKSWLIPDPLVSLA